MMALRLEAIGVCAQGLPDWSGARSVLRGDAPFDPAVAPRLTVQALPATERRRANDTSRWALTAASQAVAGLGADEVAELPTVFASADGDGEVLTQMLHDLAAMPVALSPTTFHNSVFNAPAGYWSIAARAPAASTTLCAGDASFAAGLLEAAAQAHATGGSVLLVVYDHVFPAASPIVPPARTAFACALRLAGGPGGATHGVVEPGALDHAPATVLPAMLEARFAGNAAAVALGLLGAVARGVEATLHLPYLDGTRLALRWTP